MGRGAGSGCGGPGLLQDGLVGTEPASGRW